jgi:hypothetical protein
MIKQSFRDDKHFILAQTKSKSEFDSELKFSNYNAYSIVKKILRKKDEEFICRYTEDCGTTVLDPETNNRLVDEVEFFIIENPYKGKPIPRDKPLDISGLKATLIGSEVDFVNSPSFRKIIF